MRPGTGNRFSARPCCTEVILAVQHTPVNCKGSSHDGRKTIMTGIIKPTVFKVLRKEVCLDVLMLMHGSEKN